MASPVFLSVAADEWSKVGVTEDPVGSTHTDRSAYRLGFIRTGREHRSKMKALAVAALDRNRRGERRRFIGPKKRAHVDSMSR